MIDDDLVFDDEFTLHGPNMTVSWEHIGEGMSGDHDPDDPDDVPLLRFFVYKDGEPLEDGSYCTLMPVDTPPEIMKRALVVIYRAAQQDNPKRELEELSWMRPDEIRGGTNV